MGIIWLLLLVTLLLVFDIANMLSNTVGNNFLLYLNISSCIVTKYRLTSVI